MRTRVAATLYSTLFLLATAFAPHHHINGLEDILLDQPSDSGEVVLTSPVGGDAARTGAPVLEGFTIVDDVPCLACFGSDFVSAPSPVVRYTPALDRVVLRPVPARAIHLPPSERDTPSRGPPRTA